MTLSLMFGIGAVLLLLLEMMTGALYLLALAVTCALLMLVLLAWPTLGLQVLWGAVPAGALTLWAAYRLRQRIKPAAPAQEPLGHASLLAQTPQGLRVRWRDTEWDGVWADAATVPDAEADMLLLVTGMQGSVVVVTPANDLSGAKNPPAVG